MRAQRAITFGLTVLALGISANAAQIESDIADYEAILTPSSSAVSTSNGTGGDLRVGARTSSTLSSAVFGFALPALGAGDTISSATLTITGEGENNRVPLAGAHIDLYGLGFSHGTTYASLGDGLQHLDQDGNRQYQGPDDMTVGVTKLQDDLVSSTDVPIVATGGPLTPYSKTSIDISSYLNSLYSQGAQAGDFAVLRLSQDVVAAAGSVDRFRFVSAGGDGFTIDSGIHDITAGAPYLDVSISSVPEPTTLALLGLGALGVIRRRARA
jgi:hypothetical protein